MINQTGIAVINNVAEALFTRNNIMGWFLSSFVCVLLTVFFYPYLDSWFQSTIVRALGSLNISSKHRLSGKWTHYWHVKSESFPAINEIKSVEIKQFRNLIFAQYDVLDNGQRLNTYRIIGRIKNDM